MCPRQCRGGELRLRTAQPRKILVFLPKQIYHILCDNTRSQMQETCQIFFKFS